MRPRQCALLLFGVLCITAASTASAQSSDNGSADPSHSNLDKLVEKYVTPYFDPPSWKPVTVLEYATYALYAKTADWASVVSACKAVGKAERRMYNFFIRMAFHDAMAVDVKGCTGNNKDNHANCPGADSSAILDVNEILRPENAQDGFGNMTAKAILKIASFYGVSAADALAVCSSVAVEEMSGGRIRIIGGGEDGLEKNFRVGRLDWIPGESEPAPERKLVGPEAGIETFVSFWKRNNMTIDDGIALMGTHSNLEPQDCRVNYKPIKEGASCDPRKDPDLKGECKDLRIFKWDVHYYHEVCTPNIEIVEAPAPEVPAVPWPKSMKDEEITKVMCHYSSPCERARRAYQIDLESKGKLPTTPARPYAKRVKWTNTYCENAAKYGATPEACPHSVTPDDQDWYYTVNDAYLGQVCAKETPANDDEKEIQTAMREYFDYKAWDVSFVRAWNKVLTQYGNWPLGGTEEPILINGKECKTYVLDAKCAKQKEDSPLGAILDSALKCGGCGTLKIGSTCDDCCQCYTGFGIDGLAKAGKALVEGYLTKGDPPTLPADLCDFLPKLDNPLAASSVKTRRKSSRKLH